MELFIKYPHEVQQELLHQLLNKAAQTEMGNRYGFESIRNYEDYKNRVPLVDYEDIEEQIERCRLGAQNIFWPTPIRWFAKSSGTTNAKSKFIPVSEESLEDCHYKAGKDMLSLYFNNNPQSQLLTGKCLRLGGTRELYQESNSYFGDLSAIIIENLPFWAEISSTPSHKVSLMSEWESKMSAIVAESSTQKVTSLAGVPSWMLVLLQKALEENQLEYISDLWPQIEVYFHGGVSFKPYRNQFNQLFVNQPLNYYEIYNASEGFFAIQDQNNSDELLLMLDYGIFYEFIPVSNGSLQQENICDLSQVQLDQNYAVVITTNAGLWRYQIGDTIRFTSLSPYRIQVTGRTKHHINVFGEELMIDNAEKALEKVCSAFQVQIVDYTAAPIFMDGKQKGAHEWLIEFREPPKDLELFTQSLDKALQQLNSDYEAKRYKDMTLLPPRVHLAPSGLFQNWLAENDKLGGQNKIPRLSNERSFLEELMRRV